MNQRNMMIYNKVKWVLGILMVFFLILMTNLIDRKNFVQVKNSISTIYEDRLVASDLIIKMLKDLYEKEERIKSPGPVEPDNYQSLLNKDFKLLIAAYGETKLTKEEAMIFKDLKSHLNDISSLEHEMPDKGMVDKQEILQHLSQIKENLFQLSEIQVIEGRNEMLLSQKAVEAVELFTQIEIYILISLAILVQVIVMYKPRESN